MEEAALRAHQSSFLRLKRKLFVLQPVCLLTKHGYLCFSLPPKIDIIVHMDVELNPGPASSSLRSKRKWPYRECRSGRTVKVRKATKVLIFNPPWHLVVTNLHFTQDGMTTILFVFRWYKMGHTEVHHEVSLFGMLAHWKPKYRCYVILCHLVVLTFYLWINCGLPRTIALPLPTSLIYLKITLFITCLDPPAEEVDLLLSHAKGFMFREIKAVVFYVRTFWFNHHLWWQGFRLVTVYRPPPPKKNGFTVERFFSEFSAFLEELTVTSCQLLLCGDFNFHVDDNSNANAQQFYDFLFSAYLPSPIRAHWEHTLELVAEMWKRLFVMWNAP